MEIHSVQEVCSVSIQSQFFRNMPFVFVLFFFF